MLTDRPAYAGGGLSVYTKFCTPSKEDCRAAGKRPVRGFLEDVHFHDTRHEAASRLSEKLSNVLELSAVTGHKDLRMLKRYYHPRAEDLAKKLG